MSLRGADPWGLKREMPLEVQFSSVSSCWLVPWYQLSLHIVDGSVFICLVRLALDSFSRSFFFLEAHIYSFGSKLSLKLDVLKLSLAVYPKAMPVLESR